MSREIMTQLKSARKAKRITQGDVARACGLHTSMVSLCERGLRRITLDKVVTWAALVGLRLVLERAEGE